MPGIYYPDNQPWPPDEWADIYTQYAEHAAWYSGSVEQLMNFYMGKAYTPTEKGRFWSRAVKKDMETRLHLPLACDIASMSADMLFSEHPIISLPDGDAKTEERLAEIIDENHLYRKLLEAADTASGLGGVWLKINWDNYLVSYPVINIAQVDSALPEFRFGILQAVTFWKEIEQEEHAVYRLLERHERGKIYYALYKGDDSQLGRRLSDAELINMTGLPPEVPTGIDDLLARYVPNMLPNRLFRGRYIGRSDYAGLEGMMDALDEAYTSWIWDITVGKAIVLCDESMLTNANGELKADIDKRVFVAMSTPPAEGQKLVQEIQFDIRYEEHARTCRDWIEQIVSLAGYSPRSFGLNTEGGAESGKALKIKERKSFVTTAKKAEYWKPALEEILHLALMVDRVLLRNGISADVKPRVEIQDSIVHEIGEIADSLDKLNRAEAMSTYIKVKTLHPDWDETQVLEEVERINKEKGTFVEDPIQVGIA